MPPATAGPSPPSLRTPGLAAVVLRLPSAAWRHCKFVKFVCGCCCRPLRVQAVSAFLKGKTPWWRVPKPPNMGEVSGRLPGIQQPRNGSSSQPVTRGLHCGAALAARLRGGAD